MTSREQRLERQLTSLGDAIDWPTPAPRLSTQVLARIESKPSSAGRGWRRMTIAIAAVVVVALVFVASPTARQAVADLLDAAGVRISFTADTTPVAGAGLDLGQPVSVERVPDAVGFDVRIPVGDQPGPPDGIYLSEGDQVTMVWTGTPALPAAGTTDIGLLLTQGEATHGLEVAEKAVGPGTDVHNLMVEGQPGLWIEGAPHSLTFLDAEGNPVEETTRLAANVLLWGAHGVNHRLETTGNLQTAMTFVDALQPLP